MEGGHLSATARLLGYAGLLPQLFALLLVVSGIDGALGALAAFAYAMLILSFLGGIWWGLAMRAGARQPGYAAAAVSPPLLALAMVVARLLGASAGSVLMVIGLALAASLLVDRRLVGDDLAPPGWLELRVPLSIGLGALTFLTGVLAPTAVNLVYSN